MIHSLDRALTVLEYLAEQKSAGVSEIAERFGFDKSTATRFMQTFTAHDLVVKDSLTQKYRMSNGVLKLSYNVIQNNQMLQIARPHLQELARLTQETARLCAISNGCVYIIDQVCARKESSSLQKADVPGTRKPFHCSAIGKIMMAYMPEDEARAMLEQLDRKQYTENTICNVNYLMDHLRLARARGYAENQAEYTDRAYCVAVPIFGRNGEVDYCIGFSGMTDFHQRPERFTHIVKCMKNSAQAISDKFNQSVKQAEL